MPVTERLISIVTPVYGPSARFLPEAYKSLLDQELPDGWTWEWLVQEDGDDVGAAGYLPADDPRIRISASRRGGPQVARTMAFGRSRGSLIKVADADDLLPTGTLHRDITVLTNHSEVGWTTSRVLDLLEDGSTRGFDMDPPEGVIASGAVLEHWKQHRRAQVHPASLCARRELVALLGGWLALPASGDTGLLLGLDAVSDGWFIPEVGMMYRLHEHQITRHPHHSTGEEWEARMNVMRERAEALHAWIKRS
ncbi:glycosyltransferase family 2 protein [Kitasatospora sp. NPDC056138]|uniref:glycosyltransferase family 2 protein n=1 Tax=Kitasatospora sp. NPDC056138 TaxID=3345724 RepID=UPI0035D73F11